MIWLFALVLMIPLLAVILDSSIARAIATRLEGGTAVPNPQEQERLDALEGEVERLAGEVARIQEQGEFLQRLLEERPVREALPPPAERPAPGDAS